MGIDNVKLGVCRVTYNSVDMGLTKGGCEFTYTPEYHDTTVDQYGKTIVNKILVGENVQAKVILAESTLANIKAACPAGQLVGTATQKITVGSKPGKDLLSQAKTLTLHPVALPEADHSFDITIYKAVITSELKLNFKVEEEQVVEVVFSGLVDQSKADGDMLFCIGDPAAVSA